MAPVVPASSLDNSSQAAVQSSVASAQEGASAAADGKQYVVIDGVRYVVETASLHNALPVCYKHDTASCTGHNHYAFENNLTS